MSVQEEAGSTGEPTLLPVGGSRPAHSPGSAAGEMLGLLAIPFYNVCPFKNSQACPLGVRRQAYPFRIRPALWSWVSNPFPFFVCLEGTHLVCSEYAAVL